jgi:peptidoglycan/xylan/chitin deacetylase (PgdA/CDA1 family)
MTQCGAMQTSGRVLAWLCAAAMGAQAAVIVFAQQQTPSGTARVALTFDDLPAHGPIPPGSSRAEIATKIISTLRARQAPPVYGFINAADLKEHPEDEQVLRLWRDAGFPLGNHAFTHMDLHANTVDAFEQDILANEPTLRRLMDDGDWHWFRFPYLRAGDTVLKHRQVQKFLKAQGYRVAEVTLSFDDYAYNDPYARCVAKQDAASIDWLSQSYLARAATSLTRGQAASRALFGHDIPHVMLLHIGGFETIMLPRLLDLLQQRGFTLTTLPEAERGRAYAMDPVVPDGWHGTLLDNLRLARHMTLPRESDNIFQKLAAVCK